MDIKVVPHTEQDADIIMAGPLDAAATRDARSTFSSLLDEGKRNFIIDLGDGDFIDYILGLSFEQPLGNRAAKASCNGCHNIIDPIGVAFEVYDAIGAYRTVYPDGFDIPAMGSLENRMVNQVIQYQNAGDMMTQLATTQALARCYTSKWLEWGTGHSPNDEEQAFGNHLAQNLTIRDLILELVSSPLFLQRKEYDP